MIVAVTGAGGFIGSHLVRGLRNSGISVRALLGPPGFKAVGPPLDVDSCYGEIDDREVLAKLFRGAATVAHLAGPPSVAASFQDPVAYARVHAGGTAAVVDTCIRAGVRRLVYVSSAEVYGQPRRNPVDEDGPLGPRSPYAAAKIGAEALVRAGAAVAGFEAVICRPFLVYGPGMPDGTLVASLIHQAQCGNVVEVIDPRPVRDYCFVEDAVRALVVCCSVVLPEPVRVYNLGSGTGLSVAELADRLLAMSSGSGSVRVVAAKDRPRTADILELVSDSSRAMRELGWRATIGIDVGLAQMLRSSPGRCS